MDKSRIEQIDRWAEYVRTSKGKWRRHLRLFLDAQFQIANLFYRRLAKTPEGKKKAAELRRIKNLDAAPMLK